MRRGPLVAALAPLAGALALASAAACAQKAAVASPTVLRLRPGDVFVLRPPAGKGVPEAAQFLGKRYPALALAGEGSPVFLLGLDMEAARGRETIVVSRSAGGEEQRIPVEIVKRAFPEERLTLPPAMVTPPKELEARIARDQELAASVYRESGGGALWTGGFERALPERAAGNFGRRRILNGIPKSPHGGEDYTAPAGTPVHAIAAGKVRIARDFYYSGLTVLVDHGAGLVSQYLHLEKMLVGEGEQVAAGQVIGRVGSTGRATGPHLHLGVRLFEQRVDPETLWGLFAAGKR
jgi:murein DD-endopeptidase MepM/ murein hydrolase activator NlpD